MRWLSLAFSLSLFALPAQGAKISLAFGTHEMETIEISTRKIKSRSVWLGSYRIRGRRLNERVLPTEIASELKKKLEKIIGENRRDLHPWTRNCAGRLVYVLETKREVFCIDRSSALVQRRINEWIREAQGVLEVRRSSSGR